MRKANKLVAIVLGVGAIASSISPASAVPYKGSNVYKVVKEGVTSIYISSTANSRVQVDLGSVERSTARIVGACGEVRISVPNSGSFTGLKVDGASISADSLPSQVMPSCVNGTFSEPRPDNFRTPNGQVVIVNKTPGAAVAIALPNEATRNLSVNACGFAILRATTSTALPDSFSISGTDYTTASLQDAGDAPICRTSGGESTVYVPGSWTN
ncbi:hypothetical protein [Nostoc cycadae]|uniref:Uncharacterized protein n=1 Tax=Nostoc cycadae WK-1 TaxID=1861711 RepID=A0A2H6LRA8_9NOSO|nr:hypothetical protein [Nostoc cycadae]GBE95740.1 hypothetical protein NCWK1_5528 [Nostoc cycadae WK-1]